MIAKRCRPRGPQMTLACTQNLYFAVTLFLLSRPVGSTGVTHADYPKSKQARDEAELTFEEWTATFPGRVETVKPSCLYLIKLEDSDGEFRIGLIHSTGKVFNKEVGDDHGEIEEAPHMKALWFERCQNGDHWGANPEFKQCNWETTRLFDEVPTESFLLEVEDNDLTDSSVGHKYEKPKLKQTLMRKVHWIADQYALRAEKAALSASKRRPQSAKGAKKRECSTA